MGTSIIDKYTLLHFSVGIIFRYIGFNLVSLLIAHTIFEIIENSKPGRHIINKYLKLWPGGKPAPDSRINSISDIIFSILGWMIADRFIIYSNIGWIFNSIVIIYFWILEHYL
jgi:hypothetical protein